MPFFDFDGKFDWDEYQRELADPKNIPIIGPYIGYTQGEFIPSYSEESLASMFTHAVALYAFGLSVRLAAASILMSKPLIIGTVTVGSFVGYAKHHDSHKGIVPGITQFGGVGPGYYENSSDPMGDFRRGVEGAFDDLMFWK
jgi:hypothetical protein